MLDLLAMHEFDAKLKLEVLELGGKDETEAGEWAETGCQAEVEMVESVCFWVVVQPFPIQCQFFTHTLCNVLCSSSVLFQTVYPAHLIR